MKKFLILIGLVGYFFGCYLSANNSVLFQKPQGILDATPTTTTTTTKTTTTPQAGDITNAAVINQSNPNGKAIMDKTAGVTDNPQTPETTTSSADTIKQISQAQENQGPVMGITMNPTCLRNGQCKFDIYKFLGIRQSIDDPSNPGLFVQDIILAATFFIGTIVTIGIIVSGLMFISAGMSGNDPTKAKAGLKNSVIGLLIVICSYAIIRLVQYIAKGL